MTHSLHLQPFFCFLTVFALKGPLKIFVKREEARRKRRAKEADPGTGLERQVEALETQIAELDPASDFVKVSKLRRKVILLRKQA